MRLGIKDQDRLESPFYLVSTMESLPTAPSLIPFVLSVAAHVAVGMTWYSPKLFGKVWARSYKLEFEDAVPSPFQFAGSVIVASVTAWVLGVIVQYTQPKSLMDGLELGFYCWVGFIVSTHLSNVIWTNRPLTGYLIDMVYFLISILTMSALFTLM